MKKIIYLISLVLVMTITVSVRADDDKNKLYITGKGNDLYYDSKLFDENIFMNHVDMVPGSIYKDELLIENDSNTDYDLYFKVSEVNQSESANEVLDNIYMEIYIDDELLYEGKAKGLDYNNKGVSLQDAIYIGKYNSKTAKNMVVKTRLSDEFGNIDNKSRAHIKWNFYASYSDRVTLVSPAVETNIKRYIVLSLFILLLVIIIMVYLEKKLNKN